MSHFQELAAEYSLIRLNGKKPVEKDWARYCQVKRKFEKIGFKEGDNAGIACGPASGILVVDVDDKELFQNTCSQWSWSIPETRTHETGSGKPHYLFNYPTDGNGDYRNRTFKDFGFDIRGVGGQVVAPGSIHPDTGRPYKVSNSAKISDPPSWLIDLYANSDINTDSERRVGLIDFEALPISRHVKQLILNGIEKGKRSEAIMTVLDSLVAAGLDESSILDVFEKYPIGQKFREKNGVRNKWLLAQIKKARTYISQCGDKPQIDADRQDLPKISNQAWGALSKVNRPPSIFRTSHGLIQVVENPNGNHTIEDLRVENLRHILARAARWYRRGRAGKCPAIPPSFVCQDMLVDREPQLPYLEMIVYHPVYSATGILQSTEGYAEVTGYFFSKPMNLTIPRVLERPSDAEYKKAGDLIDEILCDFPFIGDSEKAHAVGLLILPFIRLMIKGPTPLHLIEGPTPGTGKTLLAKALAFPSAGDKLHSLAEGGNHEEWRKRITASLRNPSSIILFDNLSNRLDSSSLASALTCLEWEDRLLGHSKIVSYPNRCVWAATANNPVLSPEIARRTVRIRMDSKTDQPWRRSPSDFRHPDLLEWVRKNRGDLIWACLTLIQGWIAGGKPKPREAINLGMFESWSETVGGVLEFAGISGFLRNMDDLYDTVDDEDYALRLLVERWWEDHGSREVGVSELYDTVKEFDIPLNIGGGDNERGQKIALGKYLQRKRDRQIAGRKIVPSKVSHGSQLWKLEPTPPLTSGESRS